KAPPAPSGADSDSVRTDGKKLTLRGLLHYLFEEAKFFSDFPFIFLFWFSRGLIVR
ncbi:DUF1173 family protein, partial [Acinetobacter baumannii]|nr:DUF1173 family protein [Acinetobacter baumannii]